MNFNQVNFGGNITRDPQTKQLSGGTVVCEFGIASNRKWTDGNGEQREDTTFVDVSAFGKTGENIAKYFKKGKPILVSGRLKYDAWEGKDGGKRSKLTIIADTFQFCGGDAPAGVGEDRERPQRSAPANIGQGVRQRLNERPPPQQPFGDEQHFADADIPFNRPVAQGAAAGRNTISSYKPGIDWSQRLR